MNAIRLEPAEGAGSDACPACGRGLHGWWWAGQSGCLAIASPAAGLDASAASAWWSDGACRACGAELFEIRIMFTLKCPGRKSEPERVSRAHFSGLAWEMVECVAGEEAMVAHQFGPVDASEPANWRLFREVWSILDDLPRPQGRRPSRWWPRGIRVR